MGSAITATDTTQAMKTYTGRCHCNATIFTVTIPPLETGASAVNQCNCSICIKSGYFLCYPLRENVKFLQGEDEMKSYFFGNKIRPHRFCGNCGTSVLIDFKNLEPPMNSRYAVNVRTFDGIEDMLDKINFKYPDGKGKMDPPYEPLAKQ